MGVGVFPCGVQTILNSLLAEANCNMREVTVTDWFAPPWCEVSGAVCKVKEWRGREDRWSLDIVEIFLRGSVARSVPPPKPPATR